MRRRTRWIVGTGLAVAMAGGLVAAAATDGDNDQELTEATRDRAVAAALAATGGGTVVETEAGDDGAAYGSRSASTTAARSRSNSTRASRSSARSPTRTSRPRRRPMTLRRPGAWLAVALAAALAAGCSGTGGRIGRPRPRAPP